MIFVSTVLVEAFSVIVNPSFPDITEDQQNKMKFYETNKSK